MRQQFSCRENIEMSQFSFEFLRRIDEMCTIQGVKPPDIHFNHSGYLILTDKDGAEDMVRNHELQMECGAINQLLTPAMLKRKYPWINTEGVELACDGFSGEGWLDPAALLAVCRGYNNYMGVRYIKGRVIGFEYSEVSNSKI